MASHSTMLRRRFRALQRNLRGVRMVVRAFLGTDHPLLAHIIPVRRCNLACKYCNEFDDFSKPVPVETMFRRVDKLGELGTSVITISGGEPLLHPELDDIIHRIRRHGIIAGLITNGYLLTGERIERLHRAGLEWLQISRQHCTRASEPVAVPGRRQISVYLRRRTGALLLAAARLSRDSAGAVHDCRYPSRVPHRKSLRTPLHGFLRSSGFDF